MNKQNNKCFIMGLPSAGKTTYLAALWQTINSTAPSKLKIHEYNSSKYLTLISDKWRKLEEIGRTFLDNENREIALSVKDDGNNIFNLVFPDLSGETFKNHYSKRIMGYDIVSDIKNADGISLFINIGNVKEFVLLCDLLTDDELNCNEIDSEEVSDKDNDDDTKYENREVKLIELLQFTYHLRKKVTNLNIILTAWDLQCIDITPEKYIKEELTLLWQYLQSNVDRFKTTFWGVSAQGGTLDDEKLFNCLDPTERIKVIDNDKNNQNDITLPLYKNVGGVDE